MIQVLLKAAVTQLLAVLWDTGPGTAGHLRSAETAQRAEFLNKLSFKSSFEIFTHFFKGTFVVLMFRDV